jgi:hypothetical protein
MPATVGLVMIVKNEEAVIERALRSVLPFISTWVIVDTGSTDHTKEIIQTVFSDISGLLVDRPWTSFGANRSEALALCDGRMDWALMLDADDNMAGVVPPTDVWTNPTIDGFILTIHHGSLTHNRVQIFRTGIGWCYVGVVHEYPHCASKEKTALALLPPETYMETRCEGARSSDPNKYLKDALLLETELLRNPTDHRTIFYLAQSYRDAGKPEVARRYYQRYLDVDGGWDQEKYMTLVNLIGLVETQEEKLAFVWQAIELCPDRLEAQYGFLKQRRAANLPFTMQMYAIAAASANRTPDKSWLFVTEAVYDWGIDDELAVVAFATKHYRESYEASIRCALKAPEQTMRENALNNARRAKELCQA